MPRATFTQTGCRGIGTQRSPGPYCAIEASQETVGRTASGLEQPAKMNPAAITMQAQNTISSTVGSRMPAKIAESRYFVKRITANELRAI